MGVVCAGTSNRAHNLPFPRGTSIAEEPEWSGLHCINYAPCALRQSNAGGDKAVHCCVDRQVVPRSEAVHRYEGERFGIVLERTDPRRRVAGRVGYGGFELSDLGVPNVHRARPKEPHSTFNVIDGSRVITLLSEDGAPCSFPARLSRETASQAI